MSVDNPYDPTLGGIYEEITEAIAEARGCLMDMLTAEAKEMLRIANADFMLYEGALSTYPGYHALRHALRTTIERAGGLT